MGKAANLSVCWLYKSRCSGASLLKTGDNHLNNGPLKRTPRAEHPNTPVADFEGQKPPDSFCIPQSLPEKCFKNCIFKDFFFYTQVILTKGTFGAKGMFSKCLYLFTSQHSHDGPTQPVKAISISFKDLATLGRHFFSAKIFFFKCILAFNNLLSILCSSTCLSASQEFGHSPH